GFPPAKLKDKAEKLEARKAELTELLDKADKPPPLLHPNMARMYQDRVAKLAAILRVALALDRTHQQQVHDVRANVVDSKVEIAIRTTGDAEVDLWAARRKVDLFERVFGRRVYFAAVGE
ncbi:MAG: hypothetical protein AAF266_10005, partial [Planctomycetota bacterium]